MTLERVAGCDMGFPVRAGDQAKKIILIEATRVRARQYQIEPSGRNVRLIGAAGRSGWYAERRGWTIEDLMETLIAGAPLGAVGFDFPFSIPLQFLKSRSFAAQVGHDLWDPWYGIGLKLLTYIYGIVSVLLNHKGEERARCCPYARFLHFFLGMWCIYT